MKRILSLLSLCFITQTHAEVLKYYVPTMQDIKEVLPQIIYTEDDPQTLSEIIQRQKEINKLESDLLYPFQTILLDLSELKVKKCNIQVKHNTISIVNDYTLCPDEKEKRVKQRLEYENMQKNLGYDIMVMTGFINNTINNSGYFAGVNSSNISFRAEGKYKFSERFSFLGQLDYTSWNDSNTVKVQNDSKVLPSGGFHYDAFYFKKHLFSASLLMKSFNVPIRNRIQRQVLDISTEWVPTLGLEYAFLLSPKTKIAFKGSYGKGGENLDSAMGMRMRYMHKFSDKYGAAIDLENFWLSGFEDQEQTRFHFGLYWSF